jgi:putative membrane protein
MISEATMRNFVMAAFAAMALAGCGPTTADFVQKVATSDMYEVQAGKIAAEKGQSDAVKQFGQQMVDAHTKTTEDLTGIVKTKNLKVDLPTKLDANQQKLIDDLNSAQEFDKTYAKHQVDAHQEAVNLFKKYASQGDDADVKQFAQKTASNHRTPPGSCPLDHRLREEECNGSRALLRRVSRREVEDQTQGDQLLLPKGGYPGCCEVCPRKGHDAQVLVQGQDLLFKTEWTYGHDPFPPPG